MYKKKFLVVFCFAIGFNSFGDQSNHLEKASAINEFRDLPEADKLELARYLQANAEFLKQLSKTKEDGTFAIGNEKVAEMKEKLKLLTRVTSKIGFITHKGNALFGHTIVFESEEGKTLNFVDIRSGNIVSVPKESVSFAALATGPTGEKTLVTRIYDSGYKYLIDGKLAQATNRSAEGRSGSIATTVELGGVTYKFDRPRYSDVFSVNDVAAELVIQGK